jgi:acetyl-CoA synthetase
MATPTAAYTAFCRARDLLARSREDYDTAYRDFVAPELTEFNWALDYFDVLADHNDANALIVDDGAATVRTSSFAELSRRSSQVASFLADHGVRRGDRVLCMCTNETELFETFLGCIKLGAIVIPATTLLGPADLRDRIERASIGHVVCDATEAVKFESIAGSYTRVAVGDAVPGWLDYADSASASELVHPEGVTLASDPMLWYFTSGTTAIPKLVEHSHVSYPIGHLSTMYWIGLRPGDLHANISSPGWAKHAWSSIFAPFDAGAAVFVFNPPRFDADGLLAALRRHTVTTLCAPPTVWRMLVQADLGECPPALRELVSAGEPLNPEVIAQVRSRWGITVRDGYGQTETSAQIGNPPGQPLREGSMGRPLPGYAVKLVDPLSGAPGEEGEICLEIASKPIGLMTGYREGEQLHAPGGEDGRYHTGDVARRARDGYITYIGRTDDVFKASDYRISPFELESVLVEHEAVVEAAVVPAPDPIRTAVPKAFVQLAAGYAPDRATAASILSYARQHLAPYKRVRRIEFAELPKTISGKIRRVDLRNLEQQRAALRATEGRLGAEWREEDLPELSGDPPAAS